MIGQLGTQGQASTARNYESAKIDKEAREMGSVQRELGRLIEAVNVLENATAEHVQRIQTIILAAPPSTQPNNSAPDETVCDVAESIRTVRRRIDEIATHITAATSRVDL